MVLLLLHHLTAAELVELNDTFIEAEYIPVIRDGKKYEKISFDGDA